MLWKGSSDSDPPLDPYTQQLGGLVNHSALRSLGQADLGRGTFPGTPGLLVSRGRGDFQEQASRKTARLCAAQQLCSASGAGRAWKEGPPSWLSTGAVRKQPPLG